MVYDVHIAGVAVLAISVTHWQARHCSGIGFHDVYQTIAFKISRYASVTELDFPQHPTPVCQGMKGFLTTRSTHFILRLYGVGHMVKDPWDSERGNPLPPHGLLFSISTSAIELDRQCSRAPSPSSTSDSCVSRKEVFLVNDALNTFYLRLYDVRHIVKDHSDSERGNLLPPHGLLFPINSKGSFICTIPQTGKHIPRPFVTPVVEHWLEQEIAQWVHPIEGSIRRPIALWANALTTACVSRHQYPLLNTYFFSGRVFQLS